MTDKLNKTLKRGGEFRQSLKCCDSITAPNKNKFIKKTIKGIEIDVRSKNCLYITIGKWIVYIDNSTNEKIITNYIDHGR